LRRKGRSRAAATATAPRSLPSWVIPLVVAIVTAVVFLPAVQNEFVSWDDDKNFLANPDYRGLSWTNLRWMWTTFLLGHYVPLSWMTLGLDYVIWEMNPAGYHLTNIILHAANAALVYFIARRLFQRTAEQSAASSQMALAVPAAVAALLFAIHPLRVESVAWVTERRDVLSGFFYFCAIVTYLRALDEGRGRRWYWITVALFLCALLSKATSVTLPAVLLVLNVYPLRRLGGAAGWWSESARRVYVSMIPFGLLSAATAALTFVALQPVPQLDAPGKIAVSAYSLAFYLGKTLIPVGLSPLYPMPTSIDPTAAKFVVSYGIVIGLILLTWALRHRAPGVAAALVAFVAIIFPMLGVHQNGPQIAADRYTYHAAPVLAILAGSALVRSARWEVARWSIAAVALLTLGALTWKQTQVWRDSRTLWAHALRIDTESPIAQNNWGNLLLERDSVDQAIQHYRKALSLASGFAQVHNSLGIALSRRGEFDQAIEHYRTALEIEPDYDEPDGNWGVTLARQGELSQAIDHFRRALALNPNNADAHVNWGNALVRMEKPDEAIDHYSEALRIRPNHADAHLNWGVALARLGEYSAAIEHFRSALEIKPGHPEAREYLQRATELLRAG
jgi:tetratricopeptide (TPR) repeat protein